MPSLLSLTFARISEAKWSDNERQSVRAKCGTQLLASVSHVRMDLIWPLSSARHLWACPLLRDHAAVNTSQPGACFDTSDRGRTVRQRHYSVRVAATALDLCEVSKKVTTPLLGTVVLFIGERSISNCDRTYLIPFEMSAWKAKPYLITFVSKLYDCICVTQSADCGIFDWRL